VCIQKIVEECLVDPAIVDDPNEPQSLVVKKFVVFWNEERASQKGRTVDEVRHHNQQVSLSKQELRRKLSDVVLLPITFEFQTARFLAVPWGQ